MDINNTVMILQHLRDIVDEHGVSESICSFLKDADELAGRLDFTTRDTLVASLESIELELKGFLEKAIEEGGKYGYEFEEEYSWFRKVISDKVTCTIPIGTLATSSFEAIDDMFKKVLKGQAKVTSKLAKLLAADTKDSDWNDLNGDIKAITKNLKLINITYEGKYKNGDTEIELAYDDNDKIVGGHLISLSLRNGVYKDNQYRMDG